MKKTGLFLRSLIANCYFYPMVALGLLITIPVGLFSRKAMVWLWDDCWHPMMWGGMMKLCGIEIEVRGKEYIKDGYSDSDPHIFLPARDGGEEVWMWSNTYRGTAYTDNRPIADLFGLADQWYDIIETEIVSSDYDYTYPVRPVYATTADRKSVV